MGSAAIGDATLNATTRVLVGLALGALAGLALDAYDSAVAVKVADSWCSWCC